MENSLFDPSRTLFVESSLTMRHAGDILLRLLCAFALGAFVSHRPWRRLVRRPPPAIQTDTAQTQAIIAVAAALLVVVIGDSLARAFGLVGLGTFIRFRAGVKDPRDVAVLFVMIGVGMSCGLGLVGVAAVGTAFVSVVLLLFDRFAPPRRRMLTIAVTAPDPHRVRDVVRSVFPLARTVDVRQESEGLGRACFRIGADDGEDAITVLDALRARGTPDVQSVRIEEE
jgi:hypothetical protein